MESILSFMLINTYNGTLPHSEKIQETVETYLIGMPNAALITNDVPSWCDVNFPFPLEVRSLENTQKSAANTAFIFDARESEWSASLLTPLTRNSDSKYVIIANENNTDSVSEAVLTVGLCLVLMVTVETDDIEVFELEDPCRGIRTEPKKGLSCTANVSFFYYPPDITFPNNRLSGTEGRTLQIAADLLGLELSYRRRHETDFGDFDPPSGIYGDIGSGRSIAAIGGMQGYPYRLHNANLLYSCGVTKLIWAVPLHSAPREPTWFVILVSELSTIVWICSFFIYLLFIPVSILNGYVAKKSAPWNFHILALILGVPQQIVLRRGLTMTIVLFGFLLTSYYQAIMGSKLTAPAKIPEITTLKQLADSNLRLLGVPVIGYFINLSAQAAPYDLVKVKINARFEPETGEQDDLLPKIVQNRDFAYVRHRSAIYYHSEKNPITRGNIHMVEEPSFEFIPVTLMPKHSCLSKPLQKRYHWICDSGLGSKWIKDASPKDIPPPKEGPSKLAIEHIQGFLYLLIFGWILSFTAFLCELVDHYFRGKCCRSSIPVSFKAQPNPLVPKFNNYTK